jgi:hypothetical protein
MFTHLATQCWWVASLEPGNMWDYAAYGGHISMLEFYKRVNVDTSTLTDDELRQVAQYLKMDFANDHELDFYTMCIFAVNPSAVTAIKLITDTGHSFV